MRSYDFNLVEGVKFFMKYKKIAFLFLIALAAGVMIRTLQVFYTIDGATGFFKQSYADMGFKMSVVVLGLTLIMTIIGATVHRCPARMPKVNPVLGVASIALGAGVAYELATVAVSARIPLWQIILLDITGIATVLFFIAYGAKFIHNYALPRKLYIIPVSYWMIKLVFTFTTISSLALIIDNMLMILSYCAVLIFMLEFAKLANDKDLKTNHKKLMASGICAVLLCAFISLPRLFAIVLGRSDVLHENLSSVLTTLTVGVFIAAFIFSHFRDENLSTHHRKNRLLSVNPGEGMDSFYMGSGRGKG